ncbi:MAG: hypothetical protein K0Q75_419, partial [Anaerospora sp.]|nr:hypothetical protein [Anaerospora sp.]
PNTVVKPIYAESTWLETAWEDRKSLIEKSTYECECFFALPVKKLYNFPYRPLGSNGHINSRRKK